MSGTTGFFKSNGQIRNGYIYNSGIDMVGRVITNHNLPISGTDVVNKNYCDSNNSGGVPKFNITLSGTTWTNILTDLEGVFIITVKNGMANGPTGTFNISKASSTRNASIVRWSATHGLTGEEKLQIRWNVNAGIDLRKTGTGYNGTYTIKYIDNI